MNNLKPYFCSLDGLRTVACLLVVVSHTSGPFFDYLIHYYNNNPVLLYFSKFFISGEEGVTIFFVLSGFLITYLLLFELKQNSKINLKNFYIRRALRIWPLYYFVVIFGLFIYPSITNLLEVHNNQKTNNWLNIFFLNNFDVLNLALNQIKTFNTHLQITWSVAIEEQFYLFWPLLFIVFKNSKLLLVAFFLLLTFQIFFYFSIQKNPTIFYFHTFGQLNNLVWGGIIAYFAFNYSWFKEFFLNISKLNKVIIYTAGWSIFIFKNDLINSLDLLFVRYILMVFYSFIILDFALSPNNITNFFKEDGFLVRNGKFTYGLYILHPICILLIKQVFDYFFVRTNYAIIFAYNSNWLSSIILTILTLFLSFIVARISYKYLETPFLKLKTKF